MFSAISAPLNRSPFHLVLSRSNQFLLTWVQTWVQDFNVSLCPLPAVSRRPRPSRNRRSAKLLVPLFDSNQSKSCWAHGKLRTAPRVLQRCAAILCPPLLLR